MAAPLTDRYARQIRGVLSCYDRVVVTGTIPGVCYAEGMAAFLRAQHIRIFDFPRFAEPLRDAIRTNAERLAKDNGLNIEFIRHFDSFRKEDRVQEIITQRGDHPGLVHIFSAMERCPSFEPWYDQKTGATTLRGRE